MASVIELARIKTRFWWDEIKLTGADSQKENVHMITGMARRHSACLFSRTRRAD